jgi:hypothetical protein
MLSRAHIDESGYRPCHRHTIAAAFGCREWHEDQRLVVTIAGRELTVPSWPAMRRADDQAVAFSTHSPSIASALPTMHTSPGTCRRVRGAKGSQSPEYAL